MISERKKYIIELFLKRCMTLQTMERYLNFYIELMGNSYNVQMEELLKIKKSYNIDDYVKRIIPIIDSQFTIEELQESIKFFSNSVGKKMQDPNFLYKIGKAGENMVSQIEQEFAIKNE